MASRWAVLAVDDDPSDLAVIRASMESDGVAVTTVDRGQEAVDRARRDSYDLIICNPPYVLAGAGMYRESCDICSSQTKLGINGGLGIVVPLSGISTIIEARFHMVFDAEDATDPGTTSVSNSIFVPISVGILFR